MSHRYVLMAVLVLGLGVTGLAAHPQKNSKGSPKADQNAASAPKADPAAESATYVIGPEDVLDVSVWQEPNVSRSVPVRPDGKISLPLINDIPAAGLTPMELAAAITTRLKKYLTSPQVTVTVTQMNSQRVFVVGEVNRPGPQSLIPNMTALQAISGAGGVTQFADQKHAYVLRHQGGSDETFPLNYRDLIRGDMRGNIVLKAGDTIVVP